MAGSVDILPNVEVNGRVLYPLIYVCILLRYPVPNALKRMGRGA